MNKEELQDLVEEYLNYAIDKLPIDFNLKTSAKDGFYLRTIKRLKTAFELYKSNKEYIGDFMLALREYLIVFDTDISLWSINIPNDNRYGIVQDSQTDRYFASLQLPSYIKNESFVRQAFLKELEPEKTFLKKYDLYTDPMIYNLTGYIKFKSLNQKLAVYGALNTPDGYTTLVSLPTGGGKSLITQVMSYQKEGLTVVVVPTVSLAIDQVRVAKETIHSSNIEEEIFYYSSGVNPAEILNAIKSKKARLLFISPEALIGNQKFTSIIEEANRNRYLKNLIIDEAHIVVDWGASFRMDYQCLEPWRKTLMIQNSAIRTVLLSATYEKRCVEILKSSFSDEDKWVEVRCDSLRHEPRFITVKALSHNDKFNKLLEMVRKLPHPMIIYTAYPQYAEDVKNYLQDNGILNVKTFTGKTNASSRRQLIDEWSDDKFEIMVATSAFGIGVDKRDVRTVLHLYIPSNPNAYYQELGRGGRDKLPCLSVMCYVKEDIDGAFQYIKGNVMTTDKIAGRWWSMYNSIQSTRTGNKINIDTSVKPNYNMTNISNETDASSADMNWNIYVILFLRRYNLIKIVEVKPNYKDYIFIIEILNENLLKDERTIVDFLEKYRSLEWAYYKDAFQLMKNSIKNFENDNGICWSEMFYETYDLVSEYCAGCNAHSKVSRDDFSNLPLKLVLKAPIRPIGEDQLKFLSNSKEAILFYGENNKSIIINMLGKIRLSAIIYDDKNAIEEYIKKSDIKRNLLLLDENELHCIMKKPNYYYISGVIAVVYNEDPKKIYNMLNYLKKQSEFGVNALYIHILKEDIYMDANNKFFSELIEGPVINKEVL